MRIDFNIVPTNARNHDQMKLKELLTPIVEEAISNSEQSIGSIKIQWFSEENPYLLVHKESKKTYFFSTTRINLDENFQVVSTINDYQVQESELFDNANFEPSVNHCPNENTKFVIGTPYYNVIPVVKSAVDSVYETAVNKYGKHSVVILLDQDANHKNYTKYFSCKLDGFYHIGHANGKLIMLSDGPFSYKFFETPGLNFTDTSIVFNSCWAFKNVTSGLCSTIVHDKPLHYSSGITELSIEGSTPTYACYQNRVLKGEAPASKSTLYSCAKEFDPVVPGSNAGIHLDGALFWYDPDWVTMMVNTTLSTYSFNFTSIANVTVGNYVLHLSPHESILNITGIPSDKPAFACAPNHELYHVPGLDSGIFRIEILDNFNDTLCDIWRDNQLDIYGFYPEDACQNTTQSKNDISPEYSALNFVPACPNDNVKFVLGTADHDVFHKVTNLVYETAVNKYGKDSVATLFDEKATIENFKNWFSCSGLDIFYFLSGEAYGSADAPYAPGQAFWLYNDTVLSYEFFENPGINLNLTNTVIVFNICHAFSTYSDLAVGQPGLCDAITKWSPRAYISGITALAGLGSPQATGCFVEALINNKPLDKTTLSTCADANDPTISGNEAGLYLSVSYELQGTSNFIIETNVTTYQKSLHFTHSDAIPYFVFNFNPDEAITNITVKFNDTIIQCPCNEKLFGIPGVNNQEFIFRIDTNYSNNTNFCEITSYANLLQKQFPCELGDIYGFYPQDPCTYVNTSKACFIQDQKAVPKLMSPIEERYQNIIHQEFSSQIIKSENSFLNNFLALWKNIEDKLPSCFVKDTASSAGSSLLFTFISTLTEDTLRDIYQCNDFQVALVGSMVKCFMMTLLGMGLESANISAGVQCLAAWLGFSQYTAQSIGSNVGYIYSFINGANPINMAAFLVAGCFGSDIGYRSAKWVGSFFKNKSQNDDNNLLINSSKDHAAVANL